MTDGDSFGRRSGRKPDDQQYTTPWNDDPSFDDTYSDQRPAEPRRPASRRPARQTEPDYQSEAPYGYRQPASRYPGEEQDAIRGTGAQQPSWPERPYANPPAQRVSGNQPRYAPQGSFEYDDQDAPAEIDDWGEQQPVARQRVPRRERAPRQPLPRPSVPPAISAAIAGQDSRLLLVMAGALLSLAAMVVVTLMRVDHIGGWFPMHIDASGDVTHWGSDTALWRLPFALAMMTVMNIAGAFILGLREQRLAWILIGSLPLIHIVGWIALILIGW